ncbi:suppressor of cytokine signaling 7 [Passerculus sandwichensis]
MTFPSPSPRGRVGRAGSRPLCSGWDALPARTGQEPRRARGTKRRVPVPQFPPPHPPVPERGVSPRGHGWSSVSGSSRCPPAPPSVTPPCPRVPGPGWCRGSEPLPPVGTGHSERLPGLGAGPSVGAGAALGFRCRRWARRLGAARGARCVSRGCPRGPSTCARGARGRGLRAGAGPRPPGEAGPAPGGAASGGSAGAGRRRQRGGGAAAVRGRRRRPPVPVRSRSPVPAGHAAAVAMQRDGDAAAAAAASYRVLSRLLGYGTGPEAGAAGGAGAGTGAAGAGPGGGGRLPGAGPALRSPRPQLMVFRNAAAEGRPGEDCGPVAAAAAAAAGGGVPGGGGAELCPRHRCALEPKAAAGWGAAAQSGLELQLAALGLRPPGLGAKGAAGAAGTPCPCLGPPAGEETSDALLVLEALEPDEGGSGSEDEPGSPGRGAARAGGRAAATGPAQPPAGTGTGPGGRKGSLRIRLSRLFRTKSCSGGSATGDAASAAASAGSLTDVCGARGREQEPGRKHRLTRTQSAFSPVVFSPLFTGETVSLVDVDISQRGLSSPHPPTPPPPPRRSLSLLDDISGTLPPAVLVGPMGSSLQSFPLPPPPPPHAPEAFPRIVPLRPPEAPGQPPPPHLQCPLARPDPSSFAASLRELEKCGWYWGPMNWEDAEMKLKGKPDGSFLVRDSSDPRYILSLSFRSQGITHHTRMEHYRGTFSLWCHPKFEDRCQSVVEFIKRAIMHSKNGKFLYFLRSRVPGLPPTPVQLLYPVSRFSNVKSLQHLCRFRIRQLVRIDHIPELPLPKPLISYIRKFYYYDPQEEQYLSLKEAQLISRQKQEPESST